MKTEHEIQFKIETLKEILKIYEPAETPLNKELAGKFRLGIDMLEWVLEGRENDDFNCARIF